MQKFEGGFLGYICLLSGGEIANVHRKESAIINIPLPGY